MARIKLYPYLCSHCGGTGKLRRARGADLRAVRLRAGLSQLDVARRAGWTKAYISDLENDRRRSTAAVVALYESLTLAKHPRNP